MPDSHHRKGSRLPALLIMIFASLNLMVLISELVINVSKALLPL